MTRYFFWETTTSSLRQMLPHGEVVGLVTLTSARAPRPNPHHIAWDFFIEHASIQFTTIRRAPHWLLPFGTQLYKTVGMPELPMIAVLPYPIGNIQIIQFAAASYGYES